MNFVMVNAVSHKLGEKGMKKTKLARFLSENGIKQQEIANLLGITPQQVSNLASGKSRISQEYIDKITEHYGLPWSHFYDIPDHPAELRAPYKLGREIGELDQGVVQVLLMTLEVLRSGTHYAESLMQNIQSFHAAVSGERAAEEREQRIEERERLLAARERALEDRVGLIERKLEHIEHLAPPGGESPNFPAPGASEPGPSDVPGPDKDTK